MSLISLAFVDPDDECEVTVFVVTFDADDFYNDKKMELIIILA
jgi:hypothetical protein